MSARPIQIAASIVGLAVAALFHLHYVERQDGVSAHEPLDSHLLDGSYKNEACGEIRLAEGRVFVGSASVPFSSVKIKGEPAILPEGTMHFDREAAVCSLGLTVGRRFHWALGKRSIGVVDEPTSTLVLFTKQ